MWKRSGCLKIISKKGENLKVAGQMKNLKRITQSKNIVLSLGMALTALNDCDWRRYNNNVDYFKDALDTLAALLQADGADCFHAGV